MSIGAEGGVGEGGGAAVWGAAVSGGLGGSLRGGGVVISASWAGCSGAPGQGATGWPSWSSSTALALPSRVWRWRLAWPRAPHTLAHVLRSWRISPWFVWYSMVFRFRFTVSKFTPSEVVRPGYHWPSLMGGLVSETVEQPDSSLGVSKPLIRHTYWLVFSIS